MAASNFKPLGRKGQARVDISGMDELIKDFQSLGRVARTDLRKGMREALKVVQAEAKDLLNQPDHTGRIYEIEKRGETEDHVASAPGEPPAKLLGLLRKSIQIQVARSGLAGRVRSNDPKAHVQEYGSVKQEPRPYLRKALANKVREVMTILEVAYRRAVLKALRK